MTGRAPNKRWSYGAGYEKRTRIGAAIRKYGWDAFEHIIIERGLTEQEAIDKEKYYIELYDTMNPKKGFNITAGGEGILHYKFTEEQKDRLRQSHKGIKQSKETIRKRIASMVEYYKTHPRREIPQEQIQKMIRARTGRPNYNRGIPLSEEAKENLRQKNLGKKHSLETKLKMRASSPRCKPINMYDMDDNYIQTFTSAREAMRAIGAPHSDKISSCARGIRQSAYNYKWKYNE